MKLRPEFTDVDIDQQNGGAQAYVQIDHDAAARLGIPIQAIDAALYDSFGQRQVANIYSGLNQYHVVMEVAPGFRGSPAALANVYVPAGQIVSGSATGSAPISRTGSGDVSSGNAVSTTPLTTVPLSAVASWTSASTPAQINHQDGEPSATVSFNVADGYSLGQAADGIAALMAQGGFPSTVHGSFAGTAKVFRQSTASLPLLIGAALLTIYIVLGILYESAIHPLTVLSSLPSAGVGATVALMATGQQFDLIAIIGVILLIGLVKKNAIMIIDVALDLERSFGMAPLVAVRQASLMRFRPILMTTIAAILGALPLAIGFGDGAELRRPLGIAIIGGLIASQLLTLLTTPVVYLALDRFRRRGPHEALYGRRGESEPDWNPA
jgi:multidrug efflux pump